MNGKGKQARGVERLLDNTQNEVVFEVDSVQLQIIQTGPEDIPRQTISPSS